MGTTLISFIGRGRRAEEGQPSSNAGYEATRYAFPNQDTKQQDNPVCEHSASLFTAALLDHLKTLSRPVDRWLVMGTESSTWTQLLEAVPESGYEAIDTAYAQVETAMKQTQVTQAILDAWQQALSNQLGKTQCFCRLVGNMQSVESQHLAWQALLDCVHKEDRIVLDVTHGLRHQPVLASFMLMNLRWLCKLRSVELYYGAFELKMNAACCPVLQLDIANELVEATEAAATFQHTGGYLPLIDHILQDPQQKARAQQVYFADTTNQITPEVHQAAHTLRRELATLTLSPIDKALLPLLQQSLSWVGGRNPGRQMADRASFAFNNKQYVRAILLLWEALLVTCALRENLGDIYSRNTRVQAEDCLKASLDSWDRLLVKRIEYIRNAVAHGTPPDDWRDQETLDSVTKFRQLFEEGNRLLEDQLRLLKI